MSSADDLDTAEKLFQSKKFHHCLFFVHLALEKILKALVVSKKNDVAPPIHDLVRIAQKAEIPLNDEIISNLTEISTFNIAARYDDYKFQFYKKATEEYSKKWLSIGKQVYQQLHQLL